MKKTIILLLLLGLVLSCGKESKLSQKFNCTSTKYENTKSILDFNKNFKLNIPTSWNTKLYFSEFESEIFTADTLKQLTESFILATSFNLGEIVFNEDYYVRNDSILNRNNLELIKDGNDNFQSKQAYWFVAKGIKNGFTFHQFTISSKITKNSYFNASAEIYGDDNVEERICEVISILDKVQFLQ